MENQHEIIILINEIDVLRQDKTKLENQLETEREVIVDRIERDVLSLAEQRMGMKVNGICIAEFKRIFKEVRQWIKTK